MGVKVGLSVGEIVCFKWKKIISEVKNMLQISFPIPLGVLMDVISPGLMSGPTMVLQSATAWEIWSMLKRIADEISQFIFV